MLRTATAPTRGKLAAWVRKQARRLTRQKAKRSDDRADHEKWRAMREFVYRRDLGRSRASGERLHLSHSNPFLMAHCHHITYRSAGGQDTPGNLVTLTPEEHIAEHNGRLDMHGNPDICLHFTSRDRNGRVIREWDSRCPT